MIPIRNIYYMLSYAFKALRETGYKNLASEDFQNAADLCGAILIRGSSSLLKRGLAKSYIEQTAPRTVPCGKIDITQSIKDRTIQKRQLVCVYDEFSSDCFMNRILKSTMCLLLRANINRKRKTEIRRLLPFFDEIESVDLNCVNWNTLRYDRNNQTYRMLMAICRLVCKGLVQSSEGGSWKMMDFIDEQRMCRLYEKFILEYYRQEHPALIAESSQIPWQLDDDENDFLPVMQTDITLSDPSRTRVLIIDAKYYQHTMQARFNAQKIHSTNLYQIFTYVKNKEQALSNCEHTVAGMILYAKTDEAFTPDQRYKMSGNQITITSLDLSATFDNIQAQLDSIAEAFFRKE